jgi:hypothetical protein
MHTMNQPLLTKGASRFLRNAVLVFSSFLCSQFLLFAQSNTLKVYARNGLAIDISKASEAELWASELNSGSYDFDNDICEFRIGVPSKGAGQKEAPAAERWVFRCEDMTKLGTNIRVDLWVKNCAGQWAYVTTHVLLEDLQNSCHPIATITTAEVNTEKAVSPKNTTTTESAADKNNAVVAIPPAFELHQNMPNPFKAQTLIGFTMADSGRATLKIFDATGKIWRSVDANFPKGYNEITIDRNEWSVTGTLYYTLECGSFSQTKKMILID